MNTHESYFDYLKEGLSPFKKLVFRELLNKVQEGSVLDLACGEAAVYWALGYITRAGSLTFSDYNSQFLKNLEGQIENIAPQSLEEDYGQTIAFLRDENIIPAGVTSLELAAQITEKAQDFIKYDFLSSDKLNREFDHVLSIGGLGCLDSPEDLCKAVSNIRDLVKAAGSFSGCVSPYSDTSDHVKELIANGMEGRLNPELAELKEAFELNSFIVTEIKEHPLENNYPYNSAIIFHLKSGT